MTVTEKQSRVFLSALVFPLFFTVAVLPSVSYTSEFVQQTFAQNLDGSAATTPVIDSTGIVHEHLGELDVSYHGLSNTCRGEFPLEITQKVDHIHIIGERHHGLREMLKFLKPSVRNVTVSTGLAREGYWFQREDEALRVFDKNYLERTLVLVLTRSPYDWMLHMLENPIFALNHDVPEADWKQFASRPWTMRTSSLDKEIRLAEGAHCQQGFKSGEVVPCRLHDELALELQASFDRRRPYPVYEMHRMSHRPFRNIVEFRRAKTLNLINMTKWMQHVEYLSVETLAQPSADATILEKASNLLAVLSERYGIKTCPGELKESRIHRFIEKVEPKLSKAEINVYKRYLKKKGRFSKEKETQNAVLPNFLSSKLGFLRWLTCNIHWKWENKFGYSKNNLFLADLSTGSRIKCSKSTSDKMFHPKGIL